MIRYPTKKSKYGRGKRGFEHLGESDVRISSEEAVSFDMLFASRYLKSLLESV
jgi:hypothetical protein